MFANIWGEAGVSRLIDLFSQEMATSLQLMGVSNVNQLNTSYVRSCLSLPGVDTYCQFDR
jgi:isopentenyl diphosphate isomerase/L-lactate dehydrogenase-like FMN-dependent dehydrogenase